MSRSYLRSLMSLLPGSVLFPYRSVLILRHPVFASQAESLDESVVAHAPASDSVGNAESDPPNEEESGDYDVAAELAALYGGDSPLSMQRIHSEIVANAADDLRRATHAPEDGARALVEEVAQMLEETDPNWIFLHDALAAEALELELAFRDKNIRFFASPTSAPALVH